MVSFLGALLAKESAIPCPLVAVMMGLTFAVSEARVVSRVAKGFLALFAMVPIYVLIRLFSINSVVGGYGMRAHVYLDPDTVDRLGHFALRVFLPPLPNGPYIYLSNRRALMSGAVLAVLLFFGLRFLCGIRRRILLLILALAVCFLVSVPILGNIRSAPWILKANGSCIFHPSLQASRRCIFWQVSSVGVRPRFLR
jgi:hypothetical protein